MSLFLGLCVVAGMCWTGSYPGCLTAWFRLKFPHLAVGAIASSAPVQTAVDFSQYMDVVDFALNYWGGADCVRAIRAGVDAVQMLCAAFCQLLFFFLFFFWGSWSFSEIYPRFLFLINS